MAADERNFRSSYYEKVGFRSVEEKKSLEILLKDKPLDKVKLRQFCLRFTVPGIYRNLVWKILLGVVPIHVDSHAFVMCQRQQEYTDLLRALQVMRIASEQTLKPHLFLLMWLLETRKLKFDWNLQIDNELNRHLASISHSLLDLLDDDVDAYWISKGFFNCVTKFHPDIPNLVKYTKTVLEKEDLALSGYLTSTGAFDVLPLRRWLCSCYAGVLSETALAKVWDKIVGGSYKILVFVGVVLLITLRRLLLKELTAEKIVGNLVQISEETSEVIVNKGIEMWQQYGSLLTSGIGADNMKSYVQSSRSKPI